MSSIQLSLFPYLKDFHKDSEFIENFTKKQDFSKDTCKTSLTGERSAYQARAW
jgi:hypothetical protein